MDPYLVSLALGAVGLGAMAVSGLGSHGHGGHGHASHGHGNGGHGGHAHIAHGHHSISVDTSHSHHDGLAHGSSGKVLSLMSPRVLFSLALGFGTAGLLLRPVVGGVALAAVAALGAVAFERFVVSPLWNFGMRFASRPAVTLESAVSDEATAVTAFDANGQGIVSLEVDGHVVQILATLQPNDRLLGSRVRAGQRVRIEAVDEAKNCCTVSVL